MNLGSILPTIPRSWKEETTDDFRAGLVACGLVVRSRWFRLLVLIPSEWEGNICWELAGLWSRGIAWFRR